MSQEIFKIEMSMQIFMHHSIPLSVVFIKGARVPKVLIELAVSELVHFRIEIGREVKDHEETDHESYQHGLVPARE